MCCFLCVPLHLKLRGSKLKRIVQILSTVPQRISPIFVSLSVQIRSIRHEVVRCEIFFGKNSIFQIGFTSRPHQLESQASSPRSWVELCQMEKVHYHRHLIVLSASFSPNDQSGICWVCMQTVENMNPSHGEWNDGMYTHYTVSVLLLMLLLLFASVLKTQIFDRLGVEHSSLQPPVINRTLIGFRATEILYFCLSCLAERERLNSSSQ